MGGEQVVEAPTGVLRHGRSGSASRQNSPTSPSVRARPTSSALSVAARRPPSATCSGAAPPSVYSHRHPRPPREAWLARPQPQRLRPALSRGDPDPLRQAPAERVVEALRVIEHEVIDASGSARVRTFRAVARVLAAPDPVARSVPPTSTARARPRPPPSPSTRSTSSRLRATTPSRAPHRPTVRATTRPMSRDAPVTTATTAPSRSMPTSPGAPAPAAGTCPAAWRS